MWATIGGQIVRFLLQTFALSLLTRVLEPNALNWLLGPGADQIAGLVISILTAIWSARAQLIQGVAMPLAIQAPKTATVAEVKAEAAALPLSAKIELAFPPKEEPKGIK